jgi:hypothetical protein
VPAADLHLAVDRLIGRVQHWAPARWARPSAVDGTTRAELVHGLAQRLADAGADASGEPRRPVPRLANDLALPDQLRVLATDLLAAPAPAETVDRLAADVRDTAALLS